MRLDMMRPRWSGRVRALLGIALMGLRGGEVRSAEGDLGLEKRICSGINTLTTPFGDSCSEGVAC